MLAQANDRSVDQRRRFETRVAISVSPRPCFHQADQRSASSERYVVEKADQMPGGVAMWPRQQCCTPLAMPPPPGGGELLTPATWRAARFSTACRCALRGALIWRSARSRRAFVPTPPHRTRLRRRFLSWSDKAADKPISGSLAVMTRAPATSPTLRAFAAPGLSRWQSKLRRRPRGNRKEIAFARRSAGRHRLSAQERMRGRRATGSGQLRRAGHQGR